MEIGPSFDMTIRRTRFASEDLMRESLKQPDQLKKKKEKNISKDIVGVRGALHMERQDLDQMALHKAKGLRKRKGENRQNGNIKKAKKVDESI